MREQAERLEKVKKSCKTTKTVIGVLEVLLIAMFVLCAASAIIVLANRTKVDQAVREGYESGMITPENITITEDVNMGMVKIRLGIEEMYEAGRYADAFGAVLIFGSVVFLGISIIFGIIFNIFKEIEKSETPFDEKVLKRVKVAFIAGTILSIFTASLGFAIVLGLAFWCVYNIMKYGAALQTEIDETL